MPDEDETAGASYLAALRQSKNSGSAAAPARVPETGVPGRGNVNSPPQLSPLPSDKRKSPRYKCTGSVRLQQSASAAPLWASFTDISLSGCYVESAAPYPRGAPIQMKLDVNGFHVEARGEVRVAYPGLGMGVAFTSMSEADRGHLRELVHSIARPSVLMGLRVAPQRGLIGPAETPSITNPAVALRAMVTFFENRHMMGREDFLKILRGNQ